MIVLIPCNSKLQHDIVNKTAYHIIGWHLKNILAKGMKNSYLIPTTSFAYYGYGFRMGNYSHNYY